MGSELRRLETDAITSKIIRSAINVHRHLGPGMREHTYEVCLHADLRRQRLHVERQVRVPIRYLDLELEYGFRIDMVVEHRVVVEVKAVATLAPVHVSQVLSYLKFADLEVGLLFNFNVDALVAGGWKRILRTR